MRKHGHGLKFIENPGRPGPNGAGLAASCPARRPLLEMKLVTKPTGNGWSLSDWSLSDWSRKPKDPNFHNFILEKF